MGARTIDTQRSTLGSKAPATHFTKLVESIRWPGTEADVTSLTAFAFAGNVRWVVATLWEANDFYTNSIIQAFYAKLDVNIDPARALQEAKRPFVGRTLPANYLSLTISIRDINAL